MPYDITQYSPGYGGTINSSGNVVNIADTLDEATGQFKPPAMKELTFQNLATAIGNGTVADVSGYSTLTVQLVITGTATVVFEGSIDNTNWNSMTAQGLTSSGANSTSFGSTAIWRIIVSGIKYFRARISVFTSGTVTVTGLASTSTTTPQPLATSFGSSDSASASSNLLGVGAYNLLFDGTNWTRQRSALGAGDGSASTGLPANALFGYNGTTWDRIRTVGAGDGITTGLLAQGGYGWDATGTVWNRLRTANSVLDGTSGTTMGAQSLMAFNGTSWDRVRVGKVYKHIEYLTLPDATGTTVWAPASGKKFRLMGISVSCGSAGRLALRDGSTGTDFIVRFLYAGADTKNFDFGNGYLSLQADRVLELRNNSGATVNAWVTAWGTEE